MAGVTFLPRSEISAQDADFHSATRASSLEVIGSFRILAAQTTPGFVGGANNKRQKGDLQVHQRSQDVQLTQVGAFAKIKEPDTQKGMLKGSFNRPDFNF